MKRILILFLAGLLLLSLCGCGNILFVKKEAVPSEIYTEKEIRAAEKVAISYFFKEFDSCSLISIRYAGDEKQKESAARYGADEVIVLLSDFYSGSGGDGSLSPNDLYTDWQWILVRNKGGKWRHADHGYG